MKKIIVQYLWLVTITFVLLTLALELTKPKKDPLDELMEKSIEVKEKEKVLTKKEKILKEKAFEKEWQEVDNNKDK